MLQRLRHARTVAPSSSITRPDRPRPLARSLAKTDEEDYFKNQVGVCFANYRNLNHVGRARIIFANGRLQVWLDLDQSGHYQSCLQSARTPQPTHAAAT